MKKWMVFGLIGAVAVSASANNFFGIPILGEPKDDINAVIRNLITGEHEKTGLHHKHRTPTDPKLAKTIKLSGFPTPFAACSAEKGPAQAASQATLTLIDEQYIRYTHTQ